MHTSHKRGKKGKSDGSKKSKISQVQHELSLQLSLLFFSLCNAISLFHLKKQTKTNKYNTEHGVGEVLIEAGTG